MDFHVLFLFIPAVSHGLSLILSYLYLSFSPRSSSLYNACELVLEAFFQRLPFSVASPKASIRYVCVVFCRTLYIIMTFWSVKWFKSAFSLFYAGWYSSRLGLIGPVYTWSFSCAFADRISIWFVKMFPFTLGHINVSWQNGYKSDFQFPRYI